MNGSSSGISFNRRAVLTDRALVGHTIGSSIPRMATLSSPFGHVLSFSGNRRAVLTNLTLVGYSLGISGNRRCVLTDLTLVGHCISGTI